MEIINYPVNNSIIFEKPADNWNEAFPIGNGRLGAMIFGRVSNELLQMNEDSVWLGGYELPSPTHRRKG